MSNPSQRFEALAQAMERDLYLTCYGMLGKPEDAADALQETMLRAWRGFHGFRGEAQWKTWFHRIAVNVCIDMIRRRKPDASLDTLREDGFDPRDEAAVTERRIERDEQRRRLREAILRLEEKDRVLIILRDVRGLPYEELSRVLRLPQGTVKSRLNRAREKLKRILAGDAELFDRVSVKEHEGRGDR